MKNECTRCGNPNVDFHYMFHTKTDSKELRLCQPCIKWALHYIFIEDLKHFHFIYDRAYQTGKELGVNQ